ncbi:MAG: hypothetical protein K6E51_06900 [Treponema sp.]|nr:hypothetical protein [Treponema sp.]
MISDMTIHTDASYAQTALPPRILELRTKIHDADYLDGAVQRIAQVLSDRLVENSVVFRLRG